MNKMQFVWSALAAFLLVLTATSCDPQQVAARQVAGTWDLTSMEAGGVELMETGFEQVTLFFGDYQDSLGDFRMDFKYLDGREAAWVGAYELFNEGTEMTLQVYQENLPANQDTWTLESSVERRSIFLSGAAFGHQEVTMEGEKN